MMGLVPDKILARFRVIFGIHCWQSEMVGALLFPSSQTSGTHLKLVFLLLYMLDIFISFTLLPSVVGFSLGVRTVRNLEDYTLIFLLLTDFTK